MLAPSPQSPHPAAPIINGTPYLTLRDPHDPTRTFTYYAHPDGESVNVRFQDAEGGATFGPWSVEAGHRHAAHLQQSGYLLIHHDGPTPLSAATGAADSQQGLPLQKHALVPSPDSDTLPRQGHPGATASPTMQRLTAPGRPTQIHGD